MKTTNNRLPYLLFLFFNFYAIPIFSQPAGDEEVELKDPLRQKSYSTLHLNGDSPTIDGILDDNAWNQVNWAGDFIQFMPNERADPSHQTNFKIIYDDKNLYVGIRAYDSNPEKIVKRLGQRDRFDGDWVELNIDSYNDKRTAFSFKANAAGVKGDELVSNNGQNWDSSWDPIWYLQTNIDEHGWTAEFKIPLSQLRFSSEKEQTWGIQVMRFYFRQEERSMWQYISRSDPGWVHKFGELNGIKDIKPQKQVEIMPYVVGKLERYEGEEGNPFVTGKDQSVTFGLDGKIGITNDITLDFTVNPDFGQVEADPSQLNLSAFQVFFEERRPFFIEGNNILNFSITDFRNDNLFYSRRIGGRPHGFPSVNDNAYVKIPDNTRIWGAAKLTGKNKNGLSFGVLESVTANEFAIIDENGAQTKEKIEPLTNYFVARASQDLNKGNTVFGGMFTAINRKIDQESLDFLHSSAYTAGLDLLHQWKEKKYYFAANGIFSTVNGTPESIVNTQTASERYFQRPNNNHRDVDSVRTSLTGTGGQLKIGKQAGKFLYEFGTSYLSPNLELNNLGFLMNTDLITQWISARYQINKPFKIFRRMNINVVQSASWDFGGTNTSSRLRLRYGTQFKNFWGFNLGANTSVRNISNADLRGGPSLTYPSQRGIWYWFGTDSRKRFRYMFNQWYSSGKDNYYQESGIWMRFQYRPLDVLNISISPMFNKSRNDLQYVATTNFQNDKRYISSTIDQKTYRVAIRLNYNINPNLSITYWGQPFITQGEYSDFKKITSSNAENYQDRFYTFTENEISYDAAEGKYYIDDNQNGTTDYEINNPNFNFLQFRSNAVLRWEYKPGSALFLVWTQNRTDNPPFTTIDNSLGGLTKNLFTVTPENVFLVKFTYRFIL